MKYTVFIVSNMVVITDIKGSKNERPPRAYIKEKDIVGIFMTNSKSQAIHRAGDLLEKIPEAARFIISGIFQGDIHFKSE